MSINDQNLKPHPKNMSAEFSAVSTGVVTSVAAVAAIEYFAQHTPVGVHSTFILAAIATRVIFRKSFSKNDYTSLGEYTGLGLACAISLMAHNPEYNSAAISHKFNAAKSAITRVEHMIGEATDVRIALCTPKLCASQL